MAGKVFKAGIRFNDPEVKYMALVFDEDDNSCTIDANVVVNNQPVTLRGMVSEWFPVEEEDTGDGGDPLLSVQPTRATKTTAKKAVKEK